MSWSGTSFLSYGHHPTQGPIACELNNNYVNSLVVADEAYGRQIPFAFLERVRDEFDEKFADKGRVSPAHSLDKTFGCVNEAAGHDIRRQRT
jgi:hypothetical protein